MQDSNVGLGVAARHQDSPYVGPRPFTTADRDIFFGRNQETIELTSLIKAHPEVLLYAPSGAGKTSLLYAQVLPTLQLEEDFDMLPPARVRSQESAIIPDEKINNIYVFNALKDLSNDKLSVLERRKLTLADFLAKRPRALSGEWEAQPGDQEGPEHRLPRVVVFDQFEEIFTLYPERYKDREGFFRQVADALEADQFLRVVFSMREDYIAELDPYTDILPQGMRTRFRLERLRKSNALACVKRPLETERCKETRRYFEGNAAESLVDRLMAIKVKSPSGEKIEVPGEFVDPVQLQVVCQTLWEKLPPDDVSISKEDIDKYANVDEALLDFYESSIRNAVIAANARVRSTAAGGANSPVPPEISEGVVRGWFEQKLITRENKRNMVNRERHTTAGLPNVVVDELENQHLIRVEMRGGEPWYELSHDRFVPPIRESNRRFLLQQPVAKRKAEELEQRAEDWSNAQRDPALLLNRGELADAQNWMRTEAAAIGYSEKLYALIKASEAVIQHEENERQQALADALQQKAAAEQQRADALQQKSTLERQRSRQMKIGWVVTSVLLLLTVGSTVFAWNRWQDASDAEARATKALAETTVAKKHAEEALGIANDEAIAATTAREQAEQQKREAERQKGEAERQKGEAERQKALANKESAAAQAAGQKLAAALTSTEQAKDQLVALTEKLKDARNKAYSVTASAQAQLALANNEKDLALLLALKSADEQLATSADPRVERPKQAAVRKAWLKFSESRELKGHQGTVWKAVYGPDGRIFTISEDGTVRIWPPDLKGEPVILELKAQVHDLAITTDGRYLATEQMNNEGSIWQLSDLTAKPVTLTGLTGPVATIAFSPDGKLLITEATDEQQRPAKPGAAPRIWNVPAGTVRAVLKGHEAAVCDVAFSPNGELVATASWDGTARTWDSKTGTLRAVFRNHKAPLTSIAFDPTGRWLVTASFDRTARVWNAETGEEKSTMVGHDGVVISAVFSPGGKWVLTAGKTLNKELPGVDSVSTAKDLKLPAEIEQRLGTRDVTARIWDVETGRLTTVLRGHTHDVNQASYSSDGNFIVTASADQTVKVWSAQDGRIVGELRKTAAVTSALFSPDRKSVLLSGEDYEASVWRLPSASEVVLNVSPGSVTSLRFNSDGQLVAAANDGSIRFWDPQSRGFRKVRGSDDPEARYNDAAVSPDNRYLVTAGGLQRATSSKRDYEIQKDNEPKPGGFVARVWDLQANKFLPDLTGHTAAVLSVLFSRNGDFLLTVGTDRVQVWQVGTWQKLKEFTPAASPYEPEILSAAFAEQTSEVLVLDSTARVQIWQTGTNNIRTVQLRDKDLLKGAFNGNATKIVTANDFGDLRVWTVEGKPLARLVAEEYVTSIVFSNDDRLIAASKERGGIEVWETGTGQSIAEVSERASRTNFSEVAFDSTNSMILAASPGGAVRAFKCEACQPFATILQLALQLKPRELTEDELDWYLPDINEVTALPQPIATPKRVRERSRRR